MEVEIGVGAEIVAVVAVDIQVVAVGEESTEEVECNWGKEGSREGADNTSYCCDSTGCIVQADTSFAAYSNETLQSAR